MTVTWIRHHVVTPTLTPWQKANQKVLSQKQQIDKFCKDQCVQSHWINSKIPDSTYDMVSLMFTDHRLVDIDYVDDCLQQSVSHALRFLHLSVNKFLLYSQRDRSKSLDIADFDQRLVQHWLDLLKLKTEIVHYDSQDQGSQGNWLYPLTNIVWRVNAKN